MVSELRIYAKQSCEKLFRFFFYSVNDRFESGRFNLTFLSKTSSPNFLYTLLLKQSIFIIGTIMQIESRNRVML